MSKRVEISQSPANEAIPLEQVKEIEQVKEKKIKSFTKKDNTKPLVKNAPLYYLERRFF
jgi:hypothetical protein